MVDDRGNLVVRANLEELRFKLRAFALNYWFNGMVEPCFLNHVSSLVAVVRSPEIEIKHDCLLFAVV